MSANQVCKSFTAVMVLLVGVLVGSTGWGETRDACEDRCKSVDYGPGCAKEANPSTCESLRESQCISKKCSTLTYAKESKAECTSAYREWSTVAADGEAACGAFDSTIGSTCKEKVAACGRSVGKVFDAPTTEDSGAELLLAMVKTRITSMAAPNPAAGGPGACVEQFDTKVAGEAQKELKREQERLKKEVKTEADAQTKLYEEQRKKSIEIEKDIAKITKELKKEGLKKDADMRKQIAEAAKTSIDSAKKLRTLYLSITSENNKLAQLRFAQQTAMLALTDDRVAMSCKQQLLSLKNGILNSGALDPKAPESSSIKVIADQIKNQGTKGTGNLKALLSQAQKQCFESEAAKKGQKTLDYNQRVSDINNNIKELQSQIGDEQKQTALSQDNIKKIQEQTDKEKTQEQTDAAAEISTLNKEVMLNDKSITEKLAVSAQRAKEINESIQNLVLKTNADVKMAYTDATKAIKKAEAGRSAAYAACGCDTATAANSSYCSPIRESAISPDPEAKIEKTQTKSTK